MKRAWTFAVAGAMLSLSGCGGTWVDDPGNFQRVFGVGSKKPAEVQVLHSFYWKSPHWTTEYQYFLVLRGPEAFVDKMTDKELVSPAVPSRKALDDCGANKAPAWFLPKSLNHYDMWLPVNSVNYRLLRDKENSTLYMCDRQF